MMGGGPEVAQEMAEHCHPHHWYEWMKMLVEDYLVPTILALMALAGGAVALYRKCRKKKS